MPNKNPRGCTTEQPQDHAGHNIVTRSSDMGGRPVVVCTTCNVRLSNA